MFLDLRFGYQLIVLMLVYGGYMIGVATHDTNGLMKNIGITLRLVLRGQIMGRLQTLFILRVLFRFLLFDCIGVFFSLCWPTSF